ncbi:uncharacterized protein LOC122841729 isoform X2 [Gambusia affinis]|uniref:uncharacterized protein LOC122841729 isoform X2 n=1 Tax=Gambusia affinis TaxID=33528 RepID=UPI001CDD8D8C|nr:uncharacterized protein LOC122841729 isoform X2 [Gambusia affinis]
MSSAQHLREFIRERLTAAAEEIFTEVEKTIICYEEELDAQRRMMGINWKPEIKLHRIGSELQRQSSGVQNPRVSAAAVQQVGEEKMSSEERTSSEEKMSSHDEDEAESHFTDQGVSLVQETFWVFLPQPRTEAAFHGLSNNVHHCWAPQDP